ncbi:MAG: hypothetical protein MR911_03185 [Spirochaetia bacterium]|nr:hypothetical protein [Spirochaetia bacterium]
MQNKKLNKIQIALAVLLLVFSIFSVINIALERNHECSGENCPICFVISTAEQNLKLLSLTAVFAATSSLFIASNKSVLISSKIPLIKSNTLISQKIRIND